MTKLLFDPETLRLLGVGRGRTERGGPDRRAEVALEMGATPEDIGLTIDPDPTLSETTAFAAERSRGRSPNCPTRRRARNAELIQARGVCSGRATTAAFGRLDRLRPATPRRRRRRARPRLRPLLRAGRRSRRVYDERSVVFERSRRTTTSPPASRSVSVDGTARIVAALRQLGLEPHVRRAAGRVLRRRPQREPRRHQGRRHGPARRPGAALFAAVVLVGGGDAIRAALTDIYAALELDWDPSTAGSIQDVAPHITPEAWRQRSARSLCRGADAFGRIGSVSFQLGR